eukprot:459022-Rhodomonas_salina.1
MHALGKTVALELERSACDACNSTAGNLGTNLFLEEPGAEGLIEDLTDLNAESTLTATEARKHAFFNASARVRRPVRPGRVLGHDPGLAK